MKLLDYAGLQDRGVTYSRAQLWRLWTTGKFPKPVKLSQSRNAWVASEVDDWIAARVAERDGAAA